MLKIMATLGAGSLTRHPRFADFAERNFSSICELCWAIQRRAKSDEENSDRVLKAMALLATKG